MENQEIAALYGLLAAMAYEERVKAGKPDVDPSFLQECSERYGAMEASKLMRHLG